MSEDEYLSFTVDRSDFTSQGVRCAADLYLPISVDLPPIVIMAHGLGGYRTFGLPSYAEYFARKGMATLLFDYRCFGDSDGKPRQMVHPTSQLLDWQAAIHHVRLLPDVNTSRIALWGTSYSGGHVVLVAAREKGITAIVCQVPAVDSIRYMRDKRLGFVLRVMAHGLRDKLQMAMRGQAHYIPLVGKSGKFALLNSPDSYDGYMSLVREGSGWENKIPARLAFAPPPPSNQISRYGNLPRSCGHC